MSENFVLYQRALDGFDRVIRSVPDDRWEAQSPCAEWKAIDVAGHVIGVQHRLVDGLTGKGALVGQELDTRALAGDDPVASWEAARAALAEAAAPAGALDKVVPTPFGEMPADTFAGIIVLDPLTHSWDLARAAGVDDRLDPELVSICFERIKPMDAAIRGRGVFGPARTAPDGADEQTQLLAFLGREV